MCPQKRLLQFRTKMRIQSLVDDLPGNFYVMDTGNNLVFCNKAQSHDLVQMGLRAEALDATKVEKLVKDQDQSSSVLAANLEVFSKEEPLVCIENDYGNDAIKKYLTYKAPIFNQENEIVGLYDYSVALDPEMDPNEALDSHKAILGAFFSSIIRDHIAKLSSALGLGAHHGPLKLANGQYFPYGVGASITPQTFTKMLLFQAPNIHSATPRYDPNFLSLFWLPLPPYRSCFSLHRSTHA